MDYVILLGTAVGLAMDAFAVSVCKGLAVGKMRWRDAIVIGLWFGVFQAGMPLIGYFAGSRLAGKIDSYDHWIAFGLLLAIGISMIVEAFSKKEKPETAALDFKTMLLLAIATSIDALAVGVSFSFVGVGNIFVSVGVIGLVTFAISLVGAKLGGLLGARFRSRAEFVGGIILIIIGIKMLF